MSFESLSIAVLDASHFRGIRHEQLNCSIPDIVEFPNFMRQKGLINTCVATILSTYLFIVLAIVCDDYLLPAMERLCFNLRLSYDVAGATFLAAATSAPELFVGCIATLVTKGDIGIGTVMGSSIFNLLGISAICGIFVGIDVQMSWWPITRDILWYTLSIVMLFVALIDFKVKLYEAIGFLIFYAIYLITLIFDTQLQSIFKVEGKRLLSEDPMERKEDPLKSFKQTITSRPNPDDSLWQKFWWAITYPAVVVLALTIPSARSIVFLSMIISMLWISALSYLLTWFLTIIGYNIGIPDSIMGLTVLAMGTSVPEIVTSFIVCRKGYGAMGMSNAIGSNTFNTFICLGLPWTIGIIISGKDIHMNSTGLTITTGIMMITGVLFYANFLFVKFVLGKFVGWTSLLAYITFVFIAIFIELRIIRNVCDIESPDYEPPH